MVNLKHVGRIKTNKRRVIVAYRTLPGDPYSALVILTESLPSDEHDSLIKLVESSAAQDAYELAEAMARNYLPDGRNMLAGFHATGQLKKVKTSDIEMTPNTRDIISLDQLNEIIAQQKGVALEDLAIKPSSSSESPKKVELENNSIVETPVNPQITDAVTSTPLTPEDLARQMRSQADAMFKEAKKLREQAEELSPLKKKKTEESA